MNGYAVARAFRADDALKHVVLIAVSGYTRAEDVQQAAEAGFDRHLANRSTWSLARLVSEAPEGPRRQPEQAPPPHQPP